jgi:hypothetical protein
MFYGFGRHKSLTIFFRIRKAFKILHEMFAYFEGTFAFSLREYELSRMKLHRFKHFSKGWYIAVFQEIFRICIFLTCFKKWKEGRVWISHDKIMLKLRSRDKCPWISKAATTYHKSVKLSSSISSP